MPPVAAWKLVLIVCIAGVVAGGMAISRSGTAGTAGIVERTIDAAVAPRAALPMCPSVQRQMSVRVGAIYDRYLGYTPALRVASR